MSDAPVFALHDVSRVYRTGEVEVQALRGVDLELCEGEIVVMLGPSGSGKSTLLNIMGGLDRATAGTRALPGPGPDRRRDRHLTRYRRDHVGFVFQFYNLIPSLTARENVALVTEIARDPMTPDEALELVGLKDRMDPFPGAAFGRRAAARGDRPRHRQAARGAALRRADGRARFQHRHPGARGADAHQRGTQDDDGDHHPQRRHPAIAHRVFTFRDGRIAETVHATRRARSPPK